MAASASPSPYRVVEADLAKDLGAIEEVVNRNPSAAAVPVSRRRLVWLFHDNPAGTGAAWLLSAGDSARVVGTGSLVPRSMDVGGQLAVCARASLLAVDPAHRALGPAVMIERKVSECARDQGLPVVFAVAPPATIPVFKRCGYVRIGDYVRYGKPLDAAPHITRLTGIRTAARRLAWPLNAALRLFSRDTWLDAGDTVLKELPRFDERFDDLWTRAAGQFGFTTARTSKYLTWRFADYPGDAAFTILGLLSPDERRLLGYAVFCLQGGHAHVYDVFASTTGKDLDRTLAGVVRRARAAGAGTVSLLMSGDARFERALARLGFRRREDADQPAALLLWCQDPAALARIQRDGWCIRPADNV